MGRSFVLDNIVDPVKAPITKRSLDHINNAFNEPASEIIKGLIGSYTTGDLIILRGCVVTANIPGTSGVTAGAIYYNGEVYQVDANASISTPSNTLVWSIATTYISGDPATFSDGTPHNLHEIRKMQLTNAATGTGLADYNASIVKLATNKIKLSVGDWDMDANTSVSIPHGLGANWRKIQQVKGWIRNDADTLNYNLYFRSSTATIDLQYTYDATNIYLFRIAGGDFDNTSFDSTSFNRGYIWVEYGDL